MSRLPYRELLKGQDYWIQDQALPNALEIAQRCIAKTAWTLGSAGGRNHGLECMRREP